jgi:hypothetical protein
MRSPTVMLLVVAFFGFVRFEVRAMYAMIETRQVPIGRLFTNLQQRLAQNTNSFEVTYDLARLHSMAYSTNLASVAVRTNDNRPQFYEPWTETFPPRSVQLPRSSDARAQGLTHLTNAIRLYERAILLLKQSTNANTYQWFVLPLELGRAWCLDQSGARQQALAAYRKALNLAWKKEVTGEFDFTEWAQDKWNAVKSGRNPLRTPARRGYIGELSFSEEIIEYMLKLLDPVKDAAEIADLKSKRKTLATASRLVTPILIPLQRGTDLSDLVDAHAAVAFDLDGSGNQRPWGWITPQAAWLVFDSTGRGEITSGLQMFGNVTFWIFWRNGYEALRSLDDDNDGALRGAELNSLALWHDRNSNGVSEPGEVLSAADWGVTALSCISESHSSGIFWSRQGVTFSDGETRPTYDWLALSHGSADDAN